MQLLRLHTVIGSRDIPYAFRATNVRGERTLFWLDKGAVWFLKKRNLVDFVRDRDDFVLELHLRDEFFATYPLVSHLGFNPWTIEDSRFRDEATVTTRLGQAEFKRSLLRLYDGRCAVTDVAIQAVLDAAHVVSYFGLAANVEQNGILLRADIHRLYDHKLVDFQYSGGGIVIRIGVVNTSIWTASHYSYPVIDLCGLRQTHWNGIVQARLSPAHHSRSAKGITED